MGRRLLPLLVATALAAPAVITVTAVTVVPSGPVWGQQTELGAPGALGAPAASADEPDIAEIEALMATIEARVQALGQAGSDRDQSLEFLTEQIEKAIGGMAVQEDEKAGLLRQNANLNLQVEHLAETRGALKEELQDVNARHETSVSELQEELDGLSLLLTLEKEAKTELLSANDDLAARLETAAQDRQALDRANGEQERQIDLLNEKLTVQQSELTSLTKSLAASKRRVSDKEKDLAALQKRLDLVLATRTEKLSGYRSRFLVRLDKEIGDAADVRVEGERFVFQSEALFQPGSSALTPAGKRRLAELARSLHVVSREIPNDLDWVLRVDGHTDRQATLAAAFPSNWELSAARATAVVRFLIRQGVPPYRLAATGFGEFQPLDPGDDEIAYRRNRRIEFRLTRK